MFLLYPQVKFFILSSSHSHLYYALSMNYIVLEVNIYHCSKILQLFSLSVRAWNVCSENSLFLAMHIPLHKRNYYELVEVEGKINYIIYEDQVDSNSRLFR